MSKNYERPPAALQPEDRERPYPTILSLSPQEFEHCIPEIIPIFQQAFACPPYCSDISEATAREVLNNHITKPGFNALVAVALDTGAPSGAWWYDTPQLDDFAGEWGEPLAHMASYLLENHSLDHLIWIREVFVAPHAHGQGIASRLQAEFLKQIAQAYPQGALVMARMREDNPPIQRVFAKAGATPTGIRTRTKRSAQLLHQYWYYLCQ